MHELCIGVLVEPMSQSLENIVELNHGDEGYDYDYYSDEYLNGGSNYEMASESMDLLHISKSCVLPTLTQISILYLQMFTLCFGLQILNKLCKCQFMTK